MEDERDRDGRTAEQAWALCQRLLRRYGDLLGWWSRIVELAVQLREDGQPLVEIID